MAGGVCNNENDVIRTKDECTKALSKLEYKFRKRYWEGSKRRIPSGCSVRTNKNKRPHLNDKPGLGRGRKDLVPICKEMQVKYANQFVLFSYFEFVMQQL